MAAAAASSARAGGGLRERGSSSTGYGGAKIVREIDVPVCETGEVEVSFASPAGAACHSGPCDYRGTYAWQPPSGGDLNILTTRVHGREHQSAELNLEGNGSLLRAAVLRTLPGGQTMACSDVGNQSDGVFGSVPVRRGRLQLTPSTGLVFGSRCAGPLNGDLTTRLPSMSVSVSRAEAGRTVIDLRHRVTFHAHGFSGTVRSTMTLSLGVPTDVTKQVHSAAATRRLRTISVTYRVQSLRGAAVSALRTSSDPGSCGPLDACGLTGTLALTPGRARGGSLNLVAFVPATRPKRDLLAAVGLSSTGNPSGIQVLGSGSVRFGGALTESVSQGLGCQDSTRVRGAELNLDPGPAGLPSRWRRRPRTAIDPLRTRCPGPDLGQNALAGATLAPQRSARAHRHGRLSRPALHGWALQRHDATRRCG